MAKPFGGTINVDIRDSEPDWAPFEPPKAPDGAPNVRVHRARRCRLLGDGLLRRADRDAEHRPDRRGRGALHAVAHDGVVLADAFVPTDRAESHPQQHGLHHRGGDRVSERQRHDSAGERDALGDPGRAGLEHLHGRQVASVPDRRDEPGVDPAKLAERARVRAVVRIPRGGDQSVVSGSGLRQSPGRPARARRRRATTSPTTSPTRRWSSSTTPRRSCRRSRSFSITRPGRATRRITPRRSGSTSSRAGSTRATRRCGSRPWPARRRWAWSRPTPSCRRSTRSEPRDAHRARTVSRSLRSTTRGRGPRSTRRSGGCSPGWPRCTPGSSPMPTTTSGGCSTTSSRATSSTTR